MPRPCLLSFSAHSLIPGSSLVLPSSLPVPSLSHYNTTHSQPSVSYYNIALLELLAHMNLVSNIFGENFEGITYVMNATNTKITITQSDELGCRVTQDRHIIIQGKLLEDPENRRRTGGIGRFNFNFLLLAF